MTTIPPNVDTPEAGSERAAGAHDDQPGGPAHQEPGDRGPPPSPRRSPSPESLCVAMIIQAACDAPDIAAMMSAVAQELLAWWPYGNAHACALLLDGTEYRAGSAPDDAPLLTAALVVDGVVRGAVSLHPSASTQTPAGDIPADADAIALLHRIARIVGESLARRSAVEQLRWGLELNHALARVSHTLIQAAGSLEDTCREVLASALALTNGKQGFVAYLDPETNDTVAVMHVVEPGELCTREVMSKPLRFPRGSAGLYRGLWGHSLNTRTGFFTNDPAHHPASEGAPPGHIALDSFLSAPAMMGELVLGQICLANRAGGFDARHLEAVTRIADLFALALQRRLNELKLQESEERLRTIIAKMPIMLQAFDEAGHIVAWNRECERVTGFTAEQVIGNPRALELLYADSNQRRAVERHVKAQPSNYRGWELEVTCRDGRTRTIEWSSIAARHPVTGWKSWSVGLDLTDVRRAADERRLMDAQLAHQQRLHAIGTLAAGVAHEINNPVNIILNCALLLRDAAAPGSQTAEDATEIIQESHRIANIVSSLHAFSRTGSGPVAVIPVSELVDGTMSLVRTMLAGEGIEASVHVPPGLPELRCRPDEIRQVLLSLLTNARDALNTRSPGPGAEKRIDIRAAEFRASSQAWVRLTVEDNGVGIPAEMRDRIFDPFFTTKPRAAGTGLGLYIAHNLVANHGGRIVVESELARYTRMHVELPAADDSSLRFSHKNLLDEE